MSSAFQPPENHGPYNEGLDGVLDQALNASLAGYSERLANQTDAELGLGDTWSAIQAQLSQPATVPTVDEDTLAAWASAWVDEPATLGDDLAIFETALPNWPKANSLVAEFSHLSDTVATYGQRLLGVVPDTVTTDIFTQQVMARYRSELQPAVPAPVVELFPRWAVAAIAACSLVFTVNVGNASIGAGEPSGYLASANRATVNNAPSVERYVMASCSEDLPFSDWQVVTKCQF